MSLKAWEEAGVAKQFLNPSSCSAEILSLKSLDQLLAQKIFSTSQHEETFHVLSHIK